MTQENSFKIGHLYTKDRRKRGLDHLQKAAKAKHNWYGVSLSTREAFVTWDNLPILIIAHHHSGDNESAVGLMNEQFVIVYRDWVKEL